jgi:hydroxyacylglutathione hydrolase
MLAKGGCVLDVRSPEDFGAGHIPGAVNVWIDSPQFANRAGWFVPPDTAILLVVGGPSDLGRAVAGLSRIGLDEVAGYLQWGMSEWRGQGQPVGSVPQITVHELATMREERPDLVVVDVREPFEWDEGHIEGACHLPMTEALRRIAELPAARPKAVLCAGGLRSSTVISALARAGLTGWYNVAGGMTSWVKAGYPTTRSDEGSTPR